MLERSSVDCEARDVVEMGMCDKVGGDHIAHEICCICFD